MVLNTLLVADDEIKFTNSEDNSQKALPTIYIYGSLEKQSI
jgi:uncharacterized alpha/beta hydrolase family protein